MKLLATLLLASIGLSAEACECKHGLLDAESARQASEVFVFRVISLKVDDSNPDHESWRGEGEIEVITTLKGEARGFKTVTYSYSDCCGIRLTPGLYYFAFTSDGGPVLTAHQGNLLEPPAVAYHRGDSDSYFVSAVKGMLFEGKDLQQYYWLYSWRSLAVMHPGPFNNDD